MLAMVRERGAGEGAIDVPPTIHALLQARLDALADHERLVVGHAAIEGEVFHRGSVVALVGDELLPSLENNLSSLVRKELIRPESSLIPGEDAFRFRHLLIRDAAYGAMPKKLRARLHEQFAGWLEGARVTSFELDEILGYHLEQAVSLRVELGHEGDAERELAARAGAKLVAAGHAAHGRADYAAAVGLLVRAIDRLGEDDPVRLEAHSDLAEALSRRGELERAEAVLTSAMEAARRTGNERVEARARLALNSLRTRVDPDSSVEDELEQALEIAESLERAGDLSTLGRAYAEIGMCRFMLGRAGEGEADLERAAEVARRAGDGATERSAQNSRLRPIAYGPTPAAEGIAFCTKLLESEVPTAADKAHTLQVRTLFLAMQGAFDDARRSGSEAWAVIEEFGLELLKGIYSIDVGSAEALAGDLDAAEALLRRGHERLVEMGDTGVRSTVDAGASPGETW
jgi:tetratricopeptide (TPR) repeat protein